MSIAVDYIYRNEGPTLGLSVAVDDFMKAWFCHSNQQQFVCHSNDHLSFQHFEKIAKSYSKNSDKPCLLANPAIEANLEELSCLFIPDPDLSSFLWRRAHLKGTPYATCGLVHSMSGDQVTRAVADLCLAPSNGADALICPSRAIQNSVKRVLEIHEEYLSHRFGAPIHCPVQTPVIPIGIDTSKFAARATPERRIEQRSALGIEEDEVVILFVGRLNFATKAHPLPLLLAADKAARESQKKIRLILYGYFLPEKEMETRFHTLLQDFAGSPLKCEIIQSHDARFPHGLWGAADIFTSLVDNIQESFGLTPIEAMAAGLPAVVSEWDGYKDGIRHGLDGLLIPTYMPPIDTGTDIADAFSKDRHYGKYLVGCAQSTTIDIEAAAKAFTALANNKTKRIEMGIQAKARAKNMYDWRVIIPAYEQLWLKLADDRMRYADKKQIPNAWQAKTPYFPNPMDVFEGFASRTLSPMDKMRTVLSVEAMEKLLRHDMNLYVPELLLPLPLIKELVAALSNQNGLAIQDILAICPQTETNRVWRTLGWLLKHGLCERLA